MESAVPFLDAVEDVSGGNLKIPQSEFLSHGELAVVDQGRGLVAGYTDNRGVAVRTQSPVIVFGDHTRAIKYIDFPFAMGADGVKVLRVKEGFEPKYVYHYLTARAIPSAGYSRHFKFLKELTVPKPPLAEQRRIAAILDQADALRAKRRQVLAHLDALPQTIFHHMFAREQRSVRVEDIGVDIRTGPFGSQLLHNEFVPEGIAVLGLDNVVENEFQWSQRRYITQEKYEGLRRYTVRGGDVLISIMGTTGRCVVVPEGIGVAINTKHICAISVDQTLIEPEFLRASFLWAAQSRAHLRRQTKGSIMDGLNMGIIKAMPVPLPPLERQQEFVKKLAAVANQRVACTRELEAEGRLFASLQSRAFRGEL